MAKKTQIFETAYDSYTLDSQLGQGGSGTVVAVISSDGTKYALKYLNSGSTSASKLKRFKNEIEFCSKCSHPNLLKVVDSGFTGSGTSKSLFYVMPLYASTLRMEMKKGATPQRLLQMFGKILDGVEAAHFSKVVHRDLKPENILCGNSPDDVVVADFGIAHFSEEYLVTNVETKPTERLANFRYAAPEQRYSGGRVDERSDLFALGLILNELFTGDVPHGANFAKIASKVPGYAYLDGVVDRLIQQTPDERFRSINELKMELIGRNAEFVQRQIVEEVSRQVVPASAIPKFDPIKIEEADLKDRELLLKLNQTPPPNWIDFFLQPPGGYSYTMGCEPQYFHFRGRTCSVQMRSSSAQTYVEHFKQYATKANARFPDWLREESERREADLRNELRQQIEKESEKLRILQSLKLHD